jgi:hypothetical protein
MYLVGRERLLKATKLPPTTISTNSSTLHQPLPSRTTRSHLLTLTRAISGSRLYQPSPTSVINTTTTRLTQLSDTSCGPIRNTETTDISSGLAGVLSRGRSHLLLLGQTRSPA